MNRRGLLRWFFGAAAAAVGFPLAKAEAKVANMYHNEVLGSKWAREIVLLTENAQYLSKDNPLDAIGLLTAAIEYTKYKTGVDPTIEIRHDGKPDNPPSLLWLYAQRPKTMKEKLKLPREADKTLARNGVVYHNRPIYPENVVGWRPGRTYKPSPYEGST